MKNKIFDKRGNIAAPDFKYTGEEPDWNDALTISVEDYYKRRSRALGFYAYYCDSGQLKPFVIKWMKENGYKKSDIAAIEDAPNWQPSGTVGKLCRMLQRGMPDLHVDSVEYFKKYSSEDNPIRYPESASSTIKKEIGKALVEIAENNSINQKPEKIKKIVANPYRRTLDLVETKVLPELECFLDNIANVDKSISPAKMPQCDIVAILNAEKVPPLAANVLTKWINRHLSEFSMAYEKSCSQLVQGYSFLTRAQLKKVIETFEGMLASLETYCKIKKATRKTRVKKPKAASAQIKNLKYAIDSKEYGISSVDPTRVPFAQRLYLFNTKNKQLIVYYAQNASGFSVKGCSLLHYDADKSFAVSCRKPKDTISTLLASTDKKLDKFLDEIKKKPKAVNGRVNTNMIILKTSENR